VAIDLAAAGRKRGINVAGIPPCRRTPPFDPRQSANEITVIVVDMIAIRTGCG